MEKFTLVNHPYIDSIYFKKLESVLSPWSIICISPFHVLSFLFTAVAAVFLGFATEWDIGIRSEVGRKFYEYFSSVSVSCFLAIVFYYMPMWTSPLVLYANFQDRFMGLKFLCAMMTIGISLMIGAFTTMFVLFGLVMDEVVKIPSIVLTILGAVFEGLTLLKDFCCCPGKGMVLMMKVLARLIDLVMFILWTINLASPIAKYPYIVIGVLKMVASILGTFSDVLGFICGNERDNCSKLVVSICMGAVMSSQSILIPLRADGYISLHYALCTMIVAIAYVLVALTVLFAMCCGYTVAILDDSEDEKVDVENSSEMN